MEIPQLPVEQLSWLWINMQVMHAIIKIVLFPCIYRIRLEKEAKLRRSQIWFHNRSRETTVEVKKSGHSVTTCAEWSTVSADGEAEGNFSLIYSVFFIKIQWILILFEGCLRKKTNKFFLIMITKDLSHAKEQLHLIIHSSGTMATLPKMTLHSN